MKTDDYNEPFIEKSKHRVIKTLIVLIIVAIIGYGGYYYYTNYLNNPNQTIDTIINNAKNKILNKLNTKLLTSNSLEINGLIKLDIDSKTDDEIDIYDIISYSTINFNGNIDKEKRLYDIDITSKYKNDKLLDFNVYNENDNIFVQSYEIYDKYLKLDQRFIKDILKTNDIDMSKYLINSDIKIIISAILDAYLNAMNDYDITKNDNANNNYYHLLLNKNATKDFLKKILLNLKDNDEYLKAMSLYNEDIKTSINENIDSLSNNGIDLSYEVNFYTTKEKINAKLIEIEQILNFKGNEIHINFNIIDENNYKITLSNPVNNDMTDINFTLMDNKLNITLSFTKNNKKMLFSLKTNFNDITSFTKKDISNSINISDLTDEEKDEIYNNLIGIDGFKKLSNDLISINDDDVETNEKNTEN